MKEILKINKKGNLVNTLEVSHEELKREFTPMLPIDGTNVTARIEVIIPIILDIDPVLHGFLCSLKEQVSNSSYEGIDDIIWRNEVILSKLADSSGDKKLFGELVSAFFTCYIWKLCNFKNKKHRPSVQIEF